MHTSLMTRHSTGVKTDRMGKKRTSGLHKTPRQAVQIPATWIALARQMAMKKQQPMVWWLISRIADAANAEGLPLPKYPWEEEFLIDEPKDGKKK